MSSPEKGATRMTSDHDEQIVTKLAEALGARSAVVTAGDAVAIIDVIKPIILAEEQVIAKYERSVLVYDVERLRQQWNELRATVQMMRDGARREQETMMNPDGTESAFVAEHRHFGDAFDAVLRLMDDDDDG